MVCSSSALHPQAGTTMESDSASRNHPSARPAKKSPPDTLSLIEVVVTNGAGEQVWHTPDLASWLATKIEIGYLRKFNSPADVLVADFLLHSQLKPAGKPLCSLCLCPIENDDEDLFFEYSEPILGRVERLAAAVRAGSRYDEDDSKYDEEADLCRTTVRLLLGERLLRFEFEPSPPTVEVLQNARPFEDGESETPLRRDSWFFVDCPAAPSVIGVQLWSQLFKPLCQFSPAYHDDPAPFRTARIVDQEVLCEDKTVLTKQVAVEIPNLWTKDELCYLVLAWLRSHVDDASDLDRLLRRITDTEPSVSLPVFKPQKDPKSFLLGLVDVMSVCGDSGIVFLRKLHKIETSVVYDSHRHDRAQLRLGKRAHLSLAELLWVQVVEELATDRRKNGDWELGFLLSNARAERERQCVAGAIQSSFCDAIDAGW